MNPFARVERACAQVVEGTFARFFPSDLDPAHVGRKLAARMQAAPGDLFLVRVHPADYARFAADRDFLEGRWSALLREALPPTRRAESPRALLHEDQRVVAGSVTIEAVTDERPASAYLEAHDGARIVLGDALRIGRADDNDAVIADRRVSRHHARVVGTADGFAIEDLGSANGTFLDGVPVRLAPLVDGATLTIGDTHLSVRSDAG